MIILKWALRCIIALIILMVLIVLFLLTPPGFRTGVYIASSFVPGKLSYQSASGSLLGPMKLTKLSYTNNGQSIDINSLELNWKLSELFHKKIDITQLTIHDVTVITPANPPQEPIEPTNQSLQQTLESYVHELKSIKPQPLTLPFSIQIDHASITNIKLGHAPDKIDTVIKSITLNGTINNKTIDITAKAILTQPKHIIATIDAHGNLQHYTANITLKNKLYQLTVNAIGNQDGISITIPKGYLLEGSTQGYLNLSWYPQINWDIQLDLNKVNPQIFDESLPKPITINLKTKGKLEQGVPLFDLHSHIQSKGATVKLTAHHHQLWDVHWDIHIPNIQTLYPLAHGSVTSQGSLKGTLANPQTQGTLKARQIRAEGIAVDNVTAHWNIYADSKQHSLANLHLSGIDYNNNTINELDLNLRGNIANRKLHALLTIGKHNAIIEMHAHYKDGKWLGTLAQLSSSTPNLGTWKLQRPAKFEYSPQKAFIEPICLYTNSTTYLCVQGHWQQGEPWSFSLNSKNFSFAGLEKKLMPAVQTTSKLTINAQATGIGSDIEKATAHIIIYPGMLTNFVDNNVINTAVRNSTIDLLINHQVGLTTKINFNFGINDSLDVDASIPQFTNYSIPLKDKHVKTTIRFLLHDFSIASIFEHTLKVSRGRFAGLFTVNGKAGNPKIEGNAKLYVPHFEYTMVKVHAFDIRAHLHVDGNKLTYGLVGKAFNNAPLYFTGDTTLLQPYAITHFYVHTKDAEVIKTDDLDVYATTKLKFLLTHNQLDIVGKILVPKATLAPLDFGGVTLMPVNQVTYSGLPKHIVPETSRKKVLELTLALGQKVFFKAYGAVAHLRGMLKLNIDPKQGPIANGQVRIANGQFKAYGQDLKIASGSSVSFHNSPVTDPYINARAYKHVTSDRINTGMKLGTDLITVGLQVHGTVSNMKFNLYSLPPGLSQADILSYLVVGMAADNSNAGSLALFFNTATGMVIPNTDSNNNSDESSIKKWFKSTQIHMHNETVLDIMDNPVEAQSSFILSNQLSDNLYVQYSLGVLIPESIFSIKYRLSKHWLIQSHAGSGYNVGAGADVIYSIED